MKRIIFISAAVIALSIFSCKPGTAPAAGQLQTETKADTNRKMITAYVYIREGMEEKFIAAAKSIIDSTHTEEGCLEYMLYQNPYIKNSFIFVEKYKNQAAIDAHFAAPYFAAFGTQISDMTEKPSEIKILDIAGETVK